MNSEPVWFTRRERQVLEGLQNGLRNKEIAAGLKISTQTVYFHLSAARRKVGVEDDRALQRWVHLHPEDVDRGYSRSVGISGGLKAA